MHIAKLLHPLFVIVHIEIVVPRLPERALSALDRHRQLERLNRFRQQNPFGLSQEQMDMLRHRHEAGDHKVVAETHRLKRPLEQASRGRRAQVGQTAVATEGDEVEAAALPIANQSLRPANILHRCRMR